MTGELEKIREEYLIVNDFSCPEECSVNQIKRRQTIKIIYFRLAKGWI